MLQQLGCLLGFLTAGLLVTRKTSRRRRLSIFNCSVRVIRHFSSGYPVLEMA